jgi:glycosyltransferase involved in cell wall biosynthesis
MITVLVLTYGRKHLLEEAIQSYLSQEFDGESELLIINDEVGVEYVYNHPNVRIINHPQRFSSVGKKLEFGFKQAKYDWVYRLDDDDLLTQWALQLSHHYINTNPDCDIVRCQKHYFFSNNRFEGLSDSINNGNCYSKKFINRIEFPDVSGDEDNTITFHRGGKLHIGDLGLYTMIYRWGMGTYHISAMGNYVDNSHIYNTTDKTLIPNKGIIELEPKFLNDYYTQLPELSKNILEFVKTL